MFYVHLVDDVLRRDHDRGAMSILICGARERPQRPARAKRLDLNLR